MEKENLSMEKLGDRILEISSQKEFIGTVIGNMIENEKRLEKLEKETTMLIILQGLCALTMLVRTIWG